MQLEEYFDFIGSDAIRLKGHRVGLEHVLELYHEGYSPEQIVQELPSLDLEQVYAAITYYLHNKAEVDAYLAHIERRTQEYIQAAEAHPSPIAQRMRALKQQRKQRVS